jgi:hypothetical protein
VNRSFIRELIITGTVKGTVGVLLKINNGVFDGGVELRGHITFFSGKKGSTTVGLMGMSFFTFPSQQNCHRFYCFA